MAVLNNEDLLDELITGWMDMGITGGTVLESTDILQHLSVSVPIFAGFRTLAGGGAAHNKTVFTVIENRDVLDEAVDYLEEMCLRADKTHQGVYFVAPLVSFGRLGIEVDQDKRKERIAKKIGKSRGKNSH